DGCAITENFRSSGSDREKIRREGKLPGKLVRPERVPSAGIPRAIDIDDATVRQTDPSGRRQPFGKDFRPSTGLKPADAGGVADVGRFSTWRAPVERSIESQDRRSAALVSRQSDGS